MIGRNTKQGAKEDLPFNPTLSDGGHSSNRNTAKKTLKR